MNAADTQTTKIPLRDPAKVMRLARLGSLHQSRLSFMRILTRRMAREAWRFDRPVFEIDGNGVGHAVYSAHGPDRSYSLVAFAHDLPAEKRSDRVIAEAWDCTFTLFDGVPTADDITRLSQNIPLQEAGRVSGSELSVSRANRSVRLWEHVVAALAAGTQPDQETIDAVGYLMRTTAVYGSGKLGAADREMIADRPEFATPFQVEMLSVFLTRAFVRDLVQHMANARAQADGNTAATLDPEIARSVGIGNSTGLGMAPFLLNHPVLFNNWVAARETAIARIAALPSLDETQQVQIKTLAERAGRHLLEWNVPDEIAAARIVQLRGDWPKVQAVLAETLGGANPIATALDASETWFEDTQELLIALMLEPFGDLIDGLTECMANPNVAQIDAAMSVTDLRDLVARDWDWACALDYTCEKATAQFWYVSEAKQEPRLGMRYEEEGAELESPLDIARHVSKLRDALVGEEGIVAELLMKRPELGDSAVW